MSTSATYRLEKLDEAFTALENLLPAGVVLYGSHAVAIDDAMAALEQKISETMIELYEEENR